VTSFATAEPTELLGRAEECAALDRLLREALAGESRVLVLSGEAGAGKSALLGYLSDNVAGFRVATATGVESEIELAFSGLHQLCAPLLEYRERLPDPQRLALETVFGLSAGPTPDRFVVGLATLSLFAEVAEQQPLLIMVDDVHWLDAASVQIIAFVARRLFAERIALVCVRRTGLADDALGMLPELSISGLGDSDARKLLLRNVRGPLDAEICKQILMESHGNPLALLELPRTWRFVDPVVGVTDGQPVGGKIEQSYAVRIAALPSDTQLVVLAAAAEPLGDRALLHRAVEKLGLEMAAADPAIDAGLLALNRRVQFAHPLVRSAAYRSAAAADRYRVHRALAESTDAEVDPDRRAWHRACANPGFDEDVAGELELSAGRAQARGGLSAAAVFLQRAVALTADPEPRVERALTAAQASLYAGAFEEALGLLDIAEAGALGEFQRARADLLRGQIALVSNAGREAPRLLLTAAKGFESLDASIACETYLDAWGAAMFAGAFAESDLSDVSRAAEAGPRSQRGVAASDLLLDGLASLITAGREVAAPTLRRAVGAFRDGEVPVEKGLQWGVLASTASVILWDFDSWEMIITQQADRARTQGAFAPLSIALHGQGLVVTWRGNFAAAAALVMEAATVTEATGTRIAPYGAVLLAALRGRFSEAEALIGLTIENATAGGEGLGVQFAHWASAVLYNGLGRYEEALVAASAASAEAPELFVAAWALPELIEAATRCGREDVAAGALARLIEAVSGSDSDWGLGVAARARAALSDGKAAEAFHRESLDRLNEARLPPELARAHLLYGEWLRREGRRVDAREQLRAAHNMLASIGMEAFAERAARELAATGEKVRTRSADTRDDLTPQEEQIARLAGDGLSNPEIGTLLFLSPRTVEWHLRKVFAKVGVSSRRQLRNALPSTGAAPHARDG
jgi:DNA-binding CsgD family transcriptional regulator